MTEYLAIKNWSEYQHYKDRNPPWIKLHVSILASEDWTMLADASKLTMIACMVVASRKSGVIPNNPSYIKRVAYLDELPDLEPLISCGFLIKLQADASTCKQEQATVRPESYRDIDKDKKDIDHFEVFWKVYPRKISKGKARESYQSAIAKTSPERLLSGARRYASERSGEDQKFSKHPTTWLNQECWLEEGSEPEEPPYLTIEERVRRQDIEFAERKKFDDALWEQLQANKAKEEVDEQEADAPAF